MQVGACGMALDGIEGNVIHSNRNDKPFSELSENTINFRDEKMDSLEGENNSTNLSNRKELKPIKTRNSGGDTQTKGKHSTRYNTYYRAVKSGKINPTIYGLTNHKIDGVGIGVKTARTFLEAMEKAGLIQKVEKEGKTTWARCV